jgi:steroid 5-alpha reductase family enzyme
MRGPMGIVLIGWGAMASVMVLLYLWQRVRKDAGIVDAGWAAGVGFLAILYALALDGNPSRRIVLALAAGGWGARLAVYLIRDRVLPAGEDGRYKTLRERWGPRAQIGFFLFFQIQALWAVLFSLPFLAVATNRTPSFSLADAMGIGVWIVAVGGEALSDRQLARFRANQANRGKTCRDGLWRYSRHPNYFFEWIHWFGYVLLGYGSTLWLLTLLGPSLMFLFLFKVTGIPYTEAQALKSRGDDYRRYQETTSSFIPWFPKKETR